jgi:hypothetical protein
MTQLICNHLDQRLITNLFAIVQFQNIIDSGGLLTFNTSNDKENTNNAGQLAFRIYNIPFHEL